MKNLEYELRILSIEDADDLLQLTNEIEWFFPMNYWKILLATGQVFGLYSSTNELVATTAIYDFGEQLAFLGVVIVRAKYRGQGLATRVIDAAEKSLPKTTTPVALIATDDGKPVYERRGYKVFGDCTKFLRAPDASLMDFPGLTGFQLISIQEQHLEAIKRFDVDSFGADRSHVLSVLLGENLPSVVLIDENTDRIMGYALTSIRHDTLIVGPVVAEDVSHAVVMVQQLVSDRDEEIRIDVLSHQTAFKEALEKLAFTKIEVSPVMVLGNGDDYIGKPKTFAMTSQALG
ncbi:MAG: GNAT family N-acetyltransferase [Sneathiella sp.]|nr:GNAT family N-acetyltransferase [Sneathiella sp.]